MPMRKRPIKIPVEPGFSSTRMQIPFKDLPRYPHPDPIRYKLQRAARSRWTPAGPNRNCVSRPKPLRGKIPTSQG